MNEVERHHETNYHKQRSQNLKVIAKKNVILTEAKSHACVRKQLRERSLLWRSTRKEEEVAPQNTLHFLHAPFPIISSEQKRYLFSSYTFSR